MRLTLQTDYSLRVLMYLSLNNKRLTTIKEISDCHDISRNHLMKVVYQLSLLGYIDTIRGKGGGMRLGKQPEAINIGQLVRDIEPDMNIVSCLSDSDICRLEPGCNLKGVLSEALAAFLAILDKYSLADITANRGNLLELLDLPISA